MRLALVALALALPASAAADAPPPSKAAKAPARLCRDALKLIPARDPAAARVRRLGELPPGDLTLTVVNEVGGCIEPVTIRQGYGR